MTIGTPQARERLGDLIGKLRELEPHLNIPPEQLQRFNQAVGVLSEIEAEMGAAHVPGAEATQSLRFSPELGPIINKFIQEENGYYKGFFGYYFEVLVDVFRQAAAQAAQKFMIDAVAIVTAADRVLSVLADSSRHQSYFQLNFYFENIGKYGLNLMGRERVFNEMGRLERFKTEISHAFDEVFSCANPESAYRHMRDAAEQLQRSGLFHGPRAWPAAGSCLSMLLGNYPVLPKPRTAEEEVAHSLIGLALVAAHKLFGMVIGL